MRLLIFSVLLVLLPTLSFAQFKDEAILLIKFVGFEDESEKIIIKNHLEVELSNFFELKSEEEVEGAMESALDELDSENCTQDACIKIMGKKLDVDFIINFEFIATDQEWNINAKRKGTFEGILLPINKTCHECNLEKARQEISQIVSSLNPSKSMNVGMALMIFETSPPADIFVNGNLMGKSPLEISVKAGEEIDYYIVTLGYREISELVILKPGQKLKINKKLARKRGKIKILSDPTGSAVFLDGNLQRSTDGSEDKTPIELRPTYGIHKLILKKNKFKDFETTIQINKPEHEPERFTLKPEPGRLVVTVPSENMNAQIFASGYLGSMGGRSTKSFEVPANVSLEVYAKDEQAVSLTKTVEIEPGGSEIVIFHELEAPKGFQVNLGAALAYDQFTYELKTSNKPIKTSYSLLGFELHAVLLPSRYRITIGSFSGDGEFTNQTAPFYIVVKSELFPIEKTSASLLRILVTPEWQPGWIYSIGYEKSTISYSGGSGTLNSKRNSLSIEGGYESSEFFDFMIDKDLFQETKLRYSTATGVGFSISMGGIFF